MRFKVNTVYPLNNEGTIVAICIDVNLHNCSFDIFMRHRKGQTAKLQVDIPPMFGECHRCNDARFFVRLYNSAYVNELSMLHRLKHSINGSTCTVKLDAEDKYVTAELNRGYAQLAANCIDRIMLMTLSNTITINSDIYSEDEESDWLELTDWCQL